MNRRMNMCTGWTFKSFFLVSGIIFAAGAFSASALAEGPCAADRKSLCKEMKGQWKKCLSDNMDKLSQGCKDSLTAKVQGKGAGMKEACTADVAAKCPAQALGGGLKKCLKDNYDSLSDGCKAAVDTAKSLK